MEFSTLFFDGFPYRAVCNLREPLNNLLFKLYSEAVLMVLPSQLSWREARDQCRRFGGGLHLDTSAEEVRPRSL